MLARLARLILRHRWLVIGVWLVLTVFGVLSAQRVSSRWFQSTSVPGQPAYEASQRSQNALGVGGRSPTLLVVHTNGDVTNAAGVEQAMKRAAAVVPGAFSSSYFSTGS